MGPSILFWGLMALAGTSPDPPGGATLLLKTAKKVHPSSFTRFLESSPRRDSMVADEGKTELDVRKTVWSGCLPVAEKVNYEDHNNLFRAECLELKGEWTIPACKLSGHIIFDTLFVAGVTACGPGEREITLVFRDRSLTLAHEIRDAFAREHERLREKERQHVALRTRGTRICKDLDNNRYIGFVDDVSGDRIRILVNFAVNRYAPTLAVGNFQPQVLWDDPDTWWPCQ